MDRRKVLVIVVVVLLVILYLLNLGYGLVKGDGKRPLKEYTEGFAATIQSMLGGFSPKLNGADMQCNEQRLDRSFVLTRNRPDCRIDMTAAKLDDAAYGKGLLSVVQHGGRPLSVYVRSTTDDTSAGSGTPLKCLPNSSPRDDSRLEIEYLPDAEKEPEDKKICWIKQALSTKERRLGKSAPDVSIVVMQEDRKPTLTLKRKCGRCSDSQYTIRLKWK